LTGGTDGAGPFDAVVVGTGPGGATVARELSRAGRSVAVLERGRDRRGERLYGTYAGALRYTQRGGFLFTREGMQVIRPLMVGGATGMYCGSAARPPEWLRDRYGIDLGPWVDETIRELGIRPLPAELRGKASTRLAEAASEVGMAWEPQPKFMDPARATGGELRCGAHCMLGCRCGGKWNAGAYLDEAVALGCRLRTETRARSVLVEDGRAVGVVAERRGRRLELRGEAVILSAGGLGTPEILRASGLPGAGRGLAMDATLMVYGATREPGIGREPPMTWGWTDEEQGFMLSTLVDPWLLYPVIMAVKGVREALTWPRWGRTLGVMVKIKDAVSGEIRDDGSIHKPVTSRDQERLDRGVEAARRVLERAGCDPGSLVVTPLRGTHPSATVRIGEMLTSDLETQIRRLYVCDASVFPEALDAPTVLTIVALARRLAHHLLAGERAGTPG
jgi:choline dehydrogenase-like flavoprotein